MAGSYLRVSPATHLSFPPAASCGPGEQPSCSMELHNVSDLHVVFKVKTTSQKGYAVRPNVSVIAPGAKTVVLVVLNLPVKAQAKDKFQIEAMGLAEAAGDGGVTDRFMELRAQSGNSKLPTHQIQQTAARQRAKELWADQKTGRVAMAGPVQKDLRLRVAFDVEPSAATATAAAASSSPGGADSVGSPSSARAPTHSTAGSVVTAATVGSGSGTDTGSEEVYASSLEGGKGATDTEQQQHQPPQPNKELEQLVQQFPAAVPPGAGDDTNLPYSGVSAGPSSTMAAERAAAAAAAAADALKLASGAERQRRAELERELEVVRATLTKTASQRDSLIRKTAVLESQLAAHQIREQSELRRRGGGEDNDAAAAAAAAAAPAAAAAAPVGTGASVPPTALRPPAAATAGPEDLPGKIAVALGQPPSAGPMIVQNILVAIIFLLLGKLIFGA